MKFDTLILIITKFYFGFWFGIRFDNEGLTIKFEYINTIISEVV